jgi:molybdopterin converting factor small subunit
MRSLTVRIVVKVHLKMFAILRQRSGVSQTDLELPEGATVATAMAEVGRRFSPIVPLLSRTLGAVNRDYADAGTRLKDGDELALIPPVSGG